MRVTLPNMADVIVSLSALVEKRLRSTSRAKREMECKGLADGGLTEDLWDAWVHARQLLHD